MSTSKTFRMTVFLSESPLDNFYSILNYEEQTDYLEMKQFMEDTLSAARINGEKVSYDLCLSNNIQSIQMFSSDSDQFVLIQSMLKITIK